MKNVSNLPRASDIKSWIVARPTWITGRMGEAQELNVEVIQKTDYNALAARLQAAEETILSLEGTMDADERAIKAAKYFRDNGK